MPATIELFKPDRETAKEWDSVTFRWKVSNALSVLLNGVEVKAEGSKTFPMPAGDLLVTLGATGTDGLLTTRSWTVKNTANNPAPQPAPTEDPIVSVVVTTTRKSGKVTNTPIS